jgi:ATP-binding cassette, subfamily B, bacterial
VVRRLLRSASVKGAPKTHIEPHDSPAFDSATLIRILGYIKPYKRQAAVVGGCILLASLFNLASAWFIKRIIDVAIPSGNLTLLALYCVGMVAGPALAGLIQVVQKYTAEAIGQDVMLDLRVALYRRLHEMPFAFFTRQKPGEAVSHVLNDVQGVGSVVSSTLVDIVQNAVVLVSAIVFVMVLDWRLGLVAVGVLPLFIAPTRRVGRKRKALKRATQARTSELTGILTETLSVSGALLVKTFDAGETEVQRLRAKAEELKRLSLQQSLIGRWLRMLLGLFESVGPALVFAFGGWLVIRGHIPLGTIVALVTLMKRLYNPASDLASVHVDLMTSYAYFDRVFAVLDRTPSIQEAPSAVALGRVAGRVEFRNVSFAYDQSEPALTGIDLAVEPGTRVGIVGPSGAGKTTLVSLLMRLYDATSGAVTVDGVDVRQATQASLRRNIAVVTQDTFLLHASVLENLRYGCPSASRAEIEDAARRAQIHDVILALPDGYDTIVGERGYCLSAGERQRLAIARAILKNPRILILDEATSALDTFSERLVQEALGALLQGRTCFIVAHRLSTVRDADVIVALDQGRIAEQGTHDELLAHRGLYAWLWHSQARRRELHPFPVAAEAARIATAGTHS